MRGFPLAGLLLGLLCGETHSASLEASGYIKNLHQYSRTRTTGAPYWLNLARGRIGLDLKQPLADSGSVWKPSRRAVRVHADYDHELRTGTYLKSMDYALFGLAEPPAHFRMEQKVSSGTDGHWRHRLYRGWVEYREGRTHLRFGRQRIAWGTGKLWNPTDFLNPYSPTALERDERRGTDSLHLRRPLGTYGQGEAVYALGGRWSETDLVGRVRGHVWKADVSILGGKAAASSDSWTVGGDAAADVFGGSLHGEWSYTDLRLRTPFWKTLIGYEYTFPAEPAFAPLKDAWTVLEYFRNGSGAADSARYDRGPVLNGREVTVARDYLGFGWKQDLHPLLTVEYYEVGNLNDKSYFFNPSATWNAAQGLHLTAGLQGYGGKPGTEFGPLANLVYLQGQYYF